MERKSSRSDEKKSKMMTTGNRQKAGRSTQNTQTVHRLEGRVSCVGAALEYKVRQSRRITSQMRKMVVEGDGDVWVERQYNMGRNKAARPYFRSVKTDACFWHEPPSGASHIVLLSELNKFPFLHEFATGPLGKPPSTIEKTPSCRDTSKRKNSNVGGE